jgi:hypothetical protein
MHTPTIARWVTGAAATLALAVSASAAPVEFSFSATVASGPLAGETGTGFFRFDTDAITGAGVESVDASQGLTISFDFLGQTFDQTHDALFPVFPGLILVDGVPDFLDYAVTAGVNGATFGDPGIVSFAIADFLTPGVDVRFVVPIEVELLAVPEPAPALLLAAALAALTLRRRKS